MVRPLKSEPTRLAVTVDRYDLAQKEQGLLPATACELYCSELRPISLEQDWRRDQPDVPGVD